MKFMAGFVLAALFAIIAFSIPAHAGFKGIDQTGKSLKIFDTYQCMDGLECTKFKGNFRVKVSGVATIQTSGATDALTLSQCGQTFKNSAAAVVTLPATTASNVGCKFNFIVANASNYDVDPNGTERILGLTDAAGDKIRNATVGGTITLQLIAAGQWAPTASYGTWADAN